MFPLVAMLFLVAADRSAGWDVGRDVGVLEVVTIYGMGPARALLLPVMTDSPLCSGVATYAPQVRSANG